MNSGHAVFLFCFDIYLPPRWTSLRPKYSVLSRVLWNIISLYLHMAGIWLGFGGSERRICLWRVCTFGNYVYRLQNKSSRAATGSWGKKILSCQNNEICDFSTYWVKDTRSVLSVMLSFWHLGKLHLCRGHKATKHSTSLGHRDRRQSLRAMPVSSHHPNPCLLESFFCRYLTMERRVI